MRLKKISVTDTPPIKYFEVDDLSDLVVIAGANGAGKTRLVTQIIGAFQNPRNQNVTFELESTCAEEEERFSSKRISTESEDKRTILTGLLQQNKFRRNYKSGILYFESDR